MSEDSFEIKVDKKWLYDTLMRLEGKVEEIIGHQKKTNGRVKECEGNIEDLKTFKTRALAIWAAVVAVISVIGNTVITHIMHFLT